MDQKKILAVDDDITTTMLVEAMFSERGYQVFSASGGAEALDKIVEIQPDIILLDIMMPEMDGYETCKRIKAISDFTYTPIIMLTSSDNVEAVENAYASGASDFICKPVNWPILFHRVDYALRAARAFASENQAAMLSRAIDVSPSEILICHRQSLKILNANTSAKDNLGYSRDALNALSFHDIAAISSPNRLDDSLLNLEEGEQVSLTVDMLRADGTNYPAEGFVIHSCEESSQCYIGIFQDISERKQAEEELHRMAFYDVLTGLPNRRLFQEHVERALDLAKRRGVHCAICVMDLDGFKRINDTLGHKVGDLLLKEISHRLNGLLRKTDLVAYEASTDALASQNQIARLGGDEFILLLTELDDANSVQRVAERVLKEVAQPYTVDNAELTITCSIGIALYPENGATLDELMTDADTAMYQAKQAGKNNYAFAGSSE
ncbi:MAG: diguanylate cyclase [Halioglobus sp.]